MEGSSSKSCVFYDFMGVEAEAAAASAVSNESAAWPIKRELTLNEVKDDVLYIEKEAFWTYILPNIPRNHGERLASRGDLQIMVKDERCVFSFANLSLYQGFYAITSFRNKGHTFVKGRGLVVGQKIWIRWTNGYMEVKVFE